MIGKEKLLPNIVIPTVAHPCARGVALFFPDHSFRPWEPGQKIKKIESEREAVKIE